MSRQRPLNLGFPVPVGYDSAGDRVPCLACSTGPPARWIGNPRLSMVAILLALAFLTACPVVDTAGHQDRVAAPTCAARQPHVASTVDEPDSIPASVQRRGSVPDSEYALRQNPQGSQVSDGRSAPYKSALADGTGLREPAVPSRIPAARRLANPARSRLIWFCAWLL